MKAPTKKTTPGDVFFNALKALNRHGLPDEVPMEAKARAGLEEPFSN